MRYIFDKFKFHSSYSTIFVTFVIVLKVQKHASIKLRKRLIKDATQVQQTYLLNYGENLQTENKKNIFKTLLNKPQCLHFYPGSTQIENLIIIQL